MNHGLQLVSPFYPEDYSELWEWLHEDCSANIDDTFPRTYEDWIADFPRRYECGETIYEVIQLGRPIGVIAHAPVVKGYIETFKGICFTRSACGTGVAREAVAEVLTRIFSTGVDTVAARYFASTRRVARFMAGLGAHSPLKIHAMTEQGGKSIDGEQVLIHDYAFRAIERRRGQRIDSLGDLSPQAVPAFI